MTQVTPIIAVAAALRARLDKRYRQPLTDGTPLKA